MAGPSAAAGLRGAGRWINPYRRGRAGKTLRKDLAQAGIDPSTIPARLEGNPNMVTADLSDQLRQRLSYAAAKAPRIARESVAQLSERQEGAQARIGDMLKETLGDTPSHEALATLRKEMRDAAGPLYDEFFSRNVQPNQAMMNVLATPSGKSAAKRAVKQLGNKLDVDPEMYARNNRVKLNSPYFWDELQRVIGDDVTSLQSKRPALARDRMKMRDVITEGLESKSTSYRAARSLWASGKAAEEALETGQKALREPIPELRNRFRSMSDAEKTHFRVGFFETLDKMIGNKGEFDKLSTVFKNQNKRDALRVAIGNEALYKQFLRGLRDEEAMESTWQKIKNSPLIDVPERVQTMPSMTPSMAVYQLGRRGATGAAMRPVERAEMGHLGGALMSRDPSALLSHGRPELGSMAGLAGLGGYMPGLVPSAEPPLPR